jgi:hypothetical protein
MLLKALSFATGGQCVLSYEKADGWLRATWVGYVNTADAQKGATTYLEQVGPMHCLYLLNDNVDLQGPWFNSTRWLERAWLPQAQRLGLRYVAHVVQADTRIDILTLGYAQQQLRLLEDIELQLFYDVAAAEEWLRGCQQPSRSPSVNPVLGSGSK